MKVIFVLITFSIITFSQTVCNAKKINKQELTNTIKEGVVELISWCANGEEQRSFDNAEYISINQTDSGYELKLFYQTNNDFEKNNGNDFANYYIFSIKNIKNCGNITKAELTNISIEISSWAYIDDKASGTIEINRENNLVKIMFQHSIYNNATQYKIVWKQ